MHACLVVQSCLTLCGTTSFLCPWDFPEQKYWEWVAISSSRGIFLILNPRLLHLWPLAVRFFFLTTEPLRNPSKKIIGFKPNKIYCIYMLKAVKWG